MVENESTDWMSGLVSNSSEGSGRQIEPVSSQNMMTPASSNDKMIQLISSLLESIQLSKQVPIFFSAVSRSNAHVNISVNKSESDYSNKCAPTKTDVTTSQHQLPVNEEKKESDEKIRLAIRDALLNQTAEDSDTQGYQNQTSKTPETSSSKEIAIDSQSKKTNDGDYYKGAIPQTGNEQMPRAFNAQNDIVHRMNLLEQKCKAQELLISKLYKDLIATEDKLRDAMSANKETDFDDRRERFEWGHERSYWARECSLLTHKLNSQRVHHGMILSKKKESLLPSVAFRKDTPTFVSIHEELHYTKGYNTALRAEIERLQEELKKKDISIARLGEQLRESFRRKTPEIDNSDKPTGRCASASSCSRLVSARNPRSSLDDHDERIARRIVCILKASRTGSENNGVLTRSNSTNLKGHTSSPFRKPI